ncbi:MAG: Crp/Fnr family transcriptional regulator [Chitinophagaceae bacterium]|nr:Crp/Fnr family transcriptional regulator [Chitinophagaceae bacterium]
MIKNLPPQPKEYSIRQFVTDYVDPSFKPTDELPYPTRIREAKADTQITRLNQIEDHAYYLISGYVMIMTLTEKGEMRIIDFFSPGMFFSSYYSLRHRLPSEVIVVTLSECKFEVIEYKDLKSAYESKSWLAERMGRVAAEFYYDRKNKREVGFLKLDAKKRYEIFINENPGLAKVLSIELIARYLGIDPNSLSRIRNEAKPKKS